MDLQKLDQPRPNDTEYEGKQTRTRQNDVNGEKERKHGPGPAYKALEAEMRYPLIQTRLR